MIAPMSKQPQSNPTSVAPNEMLVSERKVKRMMAERSISELVTPTKRKSSEVSDRLSDFMLSTPLRTPFLLCGPVGCLTSRIRVHFRGLYAPRVPKESKKNLSRDLR